MKDEEGEEREEREEEVEGEEAEEAEAAEGEGEGAEVDGNGGKKGTTQALRITHLFCTFIRFNTAKVCA